MDRVVILSDGACTSAVARALGRCLDVAVVGAVDEAEKMPAPTLVLLDGVATGGAPVRDQVEQAEALWPGVCVAALVAPGTGAQAEERPDGSGWASPGESEPALTGDFFRSVVDNLSSGILVADADGRFVFGNPYALAWAGLPEEELRRKTLAELCPGIADLARRGETSGETACEFCERKCHVGFRLFEMPPSGGVAAGGMIVSFTDLSRIVALRRALRLKERLAAMGEVIARVAHEIRNPLFAITGAAQILARELSLNGKHAELMESVIAQARRLNGTIQSLLDYSREIYLTPAWFDLREAGAEVVRSHPMALAVRGVRVEVAVGPPVEVKADREHTKRVIYSLVENAAEATAKGGLVEIAAGVEGEMAALRVSDRGKGVPEGDRERIFQLYFTTKMEGRGLGLPLGRKIAEAQGGTLTFGPRPGGGSVFTLLMPRSGRAG